MNYKRDQTGFGFLETKLLKVRPYFDSKSASETESSRSLDAAELAWHDCKNGIR